MSITATEGTPLDRVEAAALAEIDRVRADGITPAELTKARNQLRARLVFENDSITNIAHQLGYFQTIADWRVSQSLRERIDAVTVEQVSAAAATRLAPSNRTVGWFDPIPVSS
jgi:zinc protease